MEELIKSRVNEVRPHLDAELQLPCLRRVVVREPPEPRHVVAERRGTPEDDELPAVLLAGPGAQHARIGAFGKLPGGRS